MTENQIVPPTQIIDDLEVFEIEVDGDLRRWDKGDARLYLPEDFPVKPGKWIVRYVLLPFVFPPSNQHIVHEIDYRNLTRPDRVVTEKILDARNTNWSVKEPIVGVCGTPRSGKFEGRFNVGCIVADGTLPHRMFVLRELRSARWPKHYKAIAVVSETPI